VRTGNVLLDALPKPELQILRPHLRKMVLTKDMVLIEQGGESDRLYFPTAGLISCMAATAVGEQIEIYAAGAKDVIGLVGRAKQPWRAKVQVAGDAAAVDHGILFNLLPRLEHLRYILFEYLALLTERIGRRASCVRFHANFARLCLWLALATQIANTAELQTTHQAIADALGSRRATVTVGIGELEREKIVRGGRGWIQILDRAALQALACSCYTFLR
jgi:CRP-like cAMP-binding protein